LDVRYAENHAGVLSRPIVVCDDDERIIVAYMDKNASNLVDVDASLSSDEGRNLTVVHSLSKGADPDRLLWVQFELTDDILGSEVNIDYDLWEQSKQLHFLYSQTVSNTYRARISVLEWDVASYFSHQPQPSLAFSEDRTEALITCPSEPSWGYRLWSTDNLTDWTLEETRTGTGEPLVFTQTISSAQDRRFWRIEYVEGGF
jgi:hypothetical protein